MKNKSRLHYTAGYRHKLHYFTLETEISRLRNDEYANRKANSHDYTATDYKLLQIRLKHKFK